MGSFQAGHEEEEDGKVVFEFRHGSESEEVVWFVGWNKCRYTSMGDGWVMDYKTDVNTVFIKTSPVRF
jgi:hypothetical protein